jgi:hypothetical protein
MAPPAITIDDLTEEPAPERGARVRRMPVHDPDGRLSSDPIRARC